MKIANRTVLITGANRGVGEALVTEALRRGARKVFAGTRSGFEHPDPRVIPLTLDVTDDAQIQRAARGLDGLDLLVNNAGIALYDDLSTLDALERQLAVNCFGSLR
ncbi:MAG TPA: SDR family NAD(P)-dependent oxidoreductase, partial [Myxococcaceae bacterium]|nr:SDR family NAD(P)-dependent oxidoreductase [Myxococcaceae bacterium]